MLRNAHVTDWPFLSSWMSLRHVYVIFQIALFESITTCHLESELVARKDLKRTLVLSISFSLDNIAGALRESMSIESNDNDIEEES